MFLWCFLTKSGRAPGAKSPCHWVLKAFLTLWLVCAKLSSIHHSQFLASCPLLGSQRLYLILSCLSNLGSNDLLCALLLQIQDELLMLVFSVFHLLLEWDYGFQAPNVSSRKANSILHSLIIPLKAESRLNIVGITQNYIHFGNQDLTPSLLFLPVGLNTASSGVEGKQVNICIDAAQQL